MINNSADSDIIQWAKEILNITNEKSFAKSKLIKKTPWSTIIAIDTGREIVYLKHTPKLIALEPKIIQILHDQFHASVPTVLAENTGLNCFIMKDGGPSLREILKKKFDEALLCRAIDQFTKLQITATNNLGVLLEIGVPDWRLNKLSDIFQKVISQKNLLLADGLTETEIIELEKLPSIISTLCEKLSHYSIKESIVQPDFNDNNTLIDLNSRNITIIDLGEIAISHPFFSLLNCLQQLTKHYGYAENDSVYVRIKDCCLNNFMQHESKENVLTAFEIAKSLWPVYGTIANDRLIQACGKEKLISFQQGKLSSTLRELIATC